MGDASRDGDWACVRLCLEGDRIVDADADGLDHDLRGLTLLEAAAVDGEELVVEALAAGLPVIGVNAPGVNDLIVHGYNGLLALEDAASLAAHIVRLMADEGLRARLGDVPAIEPKL